MGAVFIQVKDRARGNVTAPMILWSIVMAVVIFMCEASHGAHHDAIWIGFGATALFGIYLGLRRRVAASFIAPLVSWTLAWIPLWIAAMIRDGFFKGLVVGLFWVTIGWVLIGGLAPDPDPGVDHDDPCALASQFQAVFPADAPAPSGDDGHPSREQSHACRVSK